MPQNDDKPKIHVPVSLQSADIYVLSTFRNQIIVLTYAVPTMDFIW